MLDAVASSIYITYIATQLSKPIMQVTTAQLAAHYHKLYTKAELQVHLQSAKIAARRQAAHIKRVGGGPLGEATYDAQMREVRALELALNFAN